MRPCNGGGHGAAGLADERGEEETAGRWMMTGWLAASCVDGWSVVQGEALDALCMNKERGSLKVAAMKVPGFGVYRQDYYTDIAIATGATFIAKEVRKGSRRRSAHLLHHLAYHHDSPSTHSPRSSA